jgi:hypothetical protein
MATRLATLVGTDFLGSTALTLLNSSLAPATYANYDILLRHLRQFFAFCNEDNIHFTESTPATMVRYTAWLGLQGFVAAGSLLPY